MANIQYVYKDPTLPLLIGPVLLPGAPGVCEFRVEGFCGATNAMWTLEHQAACCHCSIVNSINLANRYLKIPVTSWSCVPCLVVSPRAGKQFNAYYDRRSLRFFYAIDPITRQMVYTSNSADVVIHETGHALLDAIRPDLYNLQAMEVWDFHEFFGDFNAIINFLQHDFVIDYLLAQTKGDLHSSNCMSEVAPELGIAIYHATGGRNGRIEGALRNAFNEFVYMPPETLPHSCPENVICAESHNFSRIFTGAWYDILVGMYDLHKQTMSQKDALILARDTLGKYTFRAMRLAAATVRFYDAVAKSMLIVDKAENNYAYNQLMNDVFIRRGILRSPVKPMVAMDWAMFQSQLEPADEVEETSNVMAVRNRKIEVLPLPDHMVNVEAPADTFYEFNSGQCIDVVGSSAEDLINHVHYCVEYLLDTGLIRSDKLTPFEIDEEGNLVRSHFSCFNDNCQNQQAPEYNKCWKPENNSGCGCASRENTQSETTTIGIAQTIVMQKNIRQRTV